MADLVFKGNITDRKDDHYVMNIEIKDSKDEIINLYLSTHKKELFKKAIKPYTFQWNIDLFKHKQPCSLEIDFNNTKDVNGNIILAISATNDKYTLQIDTLSMKNVLYLDKSEKNYNNILLFIQKIKELHQQIEKIDL